jgi:5-methylcytosine-specific restriction protein B
VADESDLSDLWDYQLKYVVQRAFRRDDSTREVIENGWLHIFQAPTEPDSSAAPGNPGSPADA